MIETQTKLQIWDRLANLDFGPTTDQKLFLTWSIVKLIHFPDQVKFFFKSERPNSTENVFV